MKPWKSQSWREPAGNQTVLQWGHGDEAVEEVAVVIGAGIDGSTLQWGHGDEAVEEAACRRHRRGGPMLQWGHGDEAVEERERSWSCRRRRQLQWGHGDEAVEEELASWTCSPQAAGFNGATAMKPWKR